MSGRPARRTLRVGGLLQLLRDTHLALWLQEVGGQSGRSLHGCVLLAGARQLYQDWLEMCLKAREGDLCALAWRTVSIVTLQSRFIALVSLAVD